MFGLTELTGALQEPQAIEAIIPTVAIPFLLVGAIISSIATAIAAYFGIELKANGSRRMLELLLRPKVLIAAIALNFVLYGGYKGSVWLYHAARPVFIVKAMNAFVGKPSGRQYSDNWRWLGGEPWDSSLQQKLPFSNAKDFQVLWESKIPKSSFRSVSLSGNSVFAGSLDGNIYEFDRETGEVVRRFYIGKPSVPRPIVFNGTLFVGEGEHATHGSRLLAFDLKTGALKGHVRTKGHTEGDLIFREWNGRHFVFASSGSDGLYAIDASTLKVIWRSPITHFDSAVVISDDGKVFAATAIEKDQPGVIPALHALDINTGKEIWRTDLASSGWSRPVLTENKVCVGLGDIYSKARYGQLSCFDQNTGEPLLALNFQAPVFDSPQVSVVNPSVLLVTDFTGTLCAVQSGSKKWCSKADSKAPFFAVMVQDEKGNIFLTSTDGVKVFEPINGKQILSWKPASGWKRSYAGVAIADDGLFVMSGDGTLRKIIPVKESLAATVN